ncbi:hypothetical protein B0H34DRAFT_716266 [Crassisporium funariophilum]|nr:hypothetical protein B0H34DRAFT_716266 [Crassisporium funariophilum]
MDWFIGVSFVLLLLTVSMRVCFVLGGLTRLKSGKPNRKDIALFLRLNSAERICFAAPVFVGETVVNVAQHLNCQPDMIACRSCQSCGASNAEQNFVRRLTRVLRANSMFRHKQKGELPRQQCISLMSHQLTCQSLIFVCA